MIIFDTIDSTQLEAKRRIDLSTKNGEIIPEEVILAHNQTKGITTKKGDLKLSCIFNINELQKKGNISINHLPFCASLSILDCILEYDMNIDIKLKWPNDILIFYDQKYRKICGILEENYNDYFIIGIGLNLVSHPKETEHFEAVDLQQIINKKIDNIEFANKMLEGLKIYIQQTQRYGFNHIKEKWKKYAYKLGKTLLLKDNKEVLFEDIDNDGYIVATKQNGERHIIISSDEVIG